jgi:hypothetical protein
MERMTSFGRWIVLIIIVIVVIAAVVLIERGAFSPSSGTTPVATSTLPTDTYGMSEYTDPAYGFSFWYPSALTITASTTNDATSFPGGIAVETLQIGSPGGVSIVVVNSPAKTITDEPSGHASPIGQTKYFYDSASSEWMIAFPDSAQEGSARATTTADVSKATLSGLLMLPSGRRFDTTIIPLSTTRFLVVSDGGGSAFTPQLARTITLGTAAVDPSTQASALQAEANAYANQ